jgi:phage terminase large subunit-like protein
MTKSLSREEKQELLAFLEEQARRKRYRLIDEIFPIFPDEGSYRRDLYPRHMEFFRAGASHRERLFMAANRSGKSVAGGAEMTYHLTGQYPDWWEGKRFDHPIRALAAGDTSQTTRDIIQYKLLGGLWDTPEFGTGLIPRELLGKPTVSRGIANAYEEITVEHVSSGTSRLAMRSYDQGRRIFQGVEQHVVWMDEEVPRDVYEEALVRTMTTQGVVFMTFTPLQGLTPLVVDFLETRSEQEPV